MIKILNNIGYNLKYVDGTSNTSTYILGDNVTNLYIPKELSA